MLSRTALVIFGGILSWIAVFLAVLPTPGLADDDHFYPWCLDEESINAKMLPGGGEKGTVTECLISCPSDNTPVCGTDSHQYNNECFLCRAACMKKAQHNGIIDKKCDGPCPCEYKPEEEKTYHRKRPRFNDDDNDDEMYYDDMDDEL